MHTKTTQRKSLKKQGGRLGFFPFPPFLFLFLLPLLRHLSFFFFWFPSLLCSLLYSTSHFFTFLVENRIGVSCCSSFFSPISFPSSSAEFQHLLWALPIWHCLFDQKAQLLSSIPLSFLFWLLGSLNFQPL